MADMSAIALPAPMPEPVTQAPRRIGLLGFDGVAALDLAGVLEIFSFATGGDWRMAVRALVKRATLFCFAPDFTG